MVDRQRRATIYEPVVEVRTVDVSNAWLADDRSWSFQHVRVLRYDTRDVRSSSRLLARCGPTLRDITDWLHSGGNGVRFPASNRGCVAYSDEPADLERDPEWVDALALTLIAGAHRRAPLRVAASHRANVSREPARTADFIYRIC
jgi:hypothetical protein